LLVFVCYLNLFFFLQEKTVIEDRGNAPQHDHLQQVNGLGSSSATSSPMLLHQSASTSLQPNSPDESCSSLPLQSQLPLDPTTTTTTTPPRAFLAVREEDEERFLRDLGWHPEEDVPELTEEEIQEFKHNAVIAPTTNGTNINNHNGSSSRHDGRYDSARVCEVLLHA
jgi:hypothetical protein